MPRSRLYPYKDDIAEALVAGTSVYALARTYGCAKQTMQEFIARHLREHATAGNIRTASRPTRNDPFKKCQYDTLHRSGARVETSRQRAEDSYL